MTPKLLRTDPRRDTLRRWSSSGERPSCTCATRSARCWMSPTASATTRVNDRPLGPDTNAVAALVVHCLRGDRVLDRPRRPRPAHDLGIANRSSRLLPRSPSCTRWSNRRLLRSAEDLAAIDDGEDRKPTGRGDSSSKAATSPTARSWSTCSRSCISTSATWSSPPTPSPFEVEDGLRGRPGRHPRVPGRRRETRPTSHPARHCSASTVSRSRPTTSPTP